MDFLWFPHPDNSLSEKYQFEICELSNGEVVGAIAKPDFDKPWISTAPYQSHKSKAEAVAKLELKARYRIEFLTR
jgi:hypothetical protein